MGTIQRIVEKQAELRCPRCQCRDIVASMPRGIKDDFMQGMGRIPRHCRGCGKRFYAKLPVPLDPDASETQ